MEFFSRVKFTHGEFLLRKLPPSDDVPQNFYPRFFPGISSNTKSNWQKESRSNKINFRMRFLVNSTVYSFPWKVHPRKLPSSLKIILLGHPHRKLPHTNPTPPPKKRSVNFPITNTTSKHWENVIFYNRLPRHLQGRVIPRDIIDWPFNYINQNGFFKLLIRRLEKKECGRKGNSSFPPIFLVTKWGTRTVIPVWGSPLPILYEQWSDAITLAKKEKNSTELINTLPPSFLWQKLQHFIVLQTEARNPCTMVFWYAKCDAAIFSLMLRLFMDVPTLSSKQFQTNFLRHVASDGYMKLNEILYIWSRHKEPIQLMYLFLSKFCVLKFRLLLGRVAPYLQIVTTNYLIN